MKASIKARGERLAAVMLQDDAPVRIAICTEDELPRVEAEMRASGELAPDDKRVRIIVMAAPEHQGARAA